jgi:hypothetical protein
VKANHWSLVGSRHQGPVARELAAYDILNFPFPGFAG